MQTNEETPARSGWLDVDGMPGVSVRWEDGLPVCASVDEDEVFADDCEEELRQGLEVLCDRWLQVGEWSATNETDGKEEVVARITLARDQPTHRVTWTPATGKPCVSLVYLDDGRNGAGPAYSHQEWDNAEAADWAVGDDGRWYFQGQATPQGAVGEVEIRKLTPR